MSRRSLLRLAALAPACLAFARGPGVAGAAPAANNPFAGQALKSWLAGRRGEITAAVYDIDTGQEYRLNPRDTEKTASTIKVDILATALHLAQLPHHPLPADEAAAAVPTLSQSAKAGAWNLYGGSASWNAIGPFDASI